MSSNFNMHNVKRKAHREAWYGNSMNPFRKTHTGFGVQREGDLEDQNRPDVTRVSSEPPPITSGFSHDDAPSPTIRQRPTDIEKFEMMLANGQGSGQGSRQEHSSEQTAVNTPSFGKRPPSVEQTARERFISKFRRHKRDPEKQGTSTGLTGKSKSEKKFTFASQIRATILNSWINVLILAAPAGIALNYANVQQPWAIFIVNFIAIIPLAAMLSYATEEIAIRVGETLGGLLNATFGNAVELIVSILALTHKEFTIVKTSLIGSMLSNLLLVMGMCFFFGGLRRTEQFFNVTVAQTAASLLALAIASVIIPTAFDLSTTTTTVPIASISRGTAVILLIVYGCYLFFQLKTHQALYMEESQKVPMRPRKNQLAPGGISKALAAAGGVGAAQGRTSIIVDGSSGDGIMQRDAYEQQAAKDDDEAEDPQLMLWVALLTLAVSTAIIAICAECMVSSINNITGPNSAVSQEFVGLILLPIVGNAAEHATAVTVACKDKMDLAIGVAVGSSMQIALFVLPFIVIVGWGLGYDSMNLSFDGFQIAVLFVSILLVNYLIADGKSHWLEGALLQSLYLIIAVTAWFYPYVADPNN